MVKKTCPQSRSAVLRRLLWPCPTLGRLPGVRAALSCREPCPGGAVPCWGRPAPVSGPGTVWSGKASAGAPGPGEDAAGPGRQRRRQRLRVWRKPWAAPLPSSCPQRFLPSLRQGGLIHELFAGPFDSWAFSRLAAAPGDSEHTGSVRASLAEINVSAHLLFVRGSSAAAASRPGLPASGRLQGRHRLAKPRPRPCPVSGCHRSGQVPRDAAQVPPASSDWIWSAGLDVSRNLRRPAMHPQWESVSEGNRKYVWKRVLGG